MGNSVACRIFSSFPSLISQWFSTWGETVMDYTRISRAAFQITGMPCFIALRFTVFHTCWVLHELNARPSASKKITTRFIVTLVFLRWSGTEPAISLRYVILYTQFSQLIPFPNSGMPFRFWRVPQVIVKLYPSPTPQYQLWTTERNFDPGHAKFNFFSERQLIIVFRYLVLIWGGWSQVRGQIYLLDTPTVINRSYSREISCWMFLSGQIECPFY